MENFGNSTDLQGNEALDDTLLGNELADVAGEVMADVPSMDETFGPSKSEGTPESAQGKKPEQKEKQKQPELIKTVADLQEWCKENGLKKDSDNISFKRDRKNSETGLHKGETTLEYEIYKQNYTYGLYMPSGTVYLKIGKSDGNIDISYYPEVGEVINISNPTIKDIQDALKIFNREIVAYETIQKNEKRRENQKKAKVVKGM